MKSDLSILFSRGQNNISPSFISSTHTLL